MSHNEQDLEIGRPVREHGDRRKEYLALSAKLKRIGSALQQASGGMMNADSGMYSENTFQSKKCLEPIVSEVDLAAILFT